MSGLAKRLLILSAAALLPLSYCKLDVGESPIGPDANRTNPNDTNYTFTLTSSKTELKADGIDTAFITAKVIDRSSHPVISDTIKFKGTRGTIPSFALTDSSGVAVVRLRSDRINDTCIVSAVSAKTGKVDSIRVAFSGVTLQLKFNANSFRVNDYATLTAKLTDGADAPISGDSIVFSTTSGLFYSNATTARSTLDASGSATVKVTSRTPGTLSVTAAIPARHINDSITITVDTTSSAITVTRQFRLYSSKTQLKADNSDTATITAILIDENNNPAVGDTVSFQATMGSIGARAIIDSSGRGKVVLHSAPKNGICNIKATSSSTKDTAATEVIFAGVKVRLESDVSDLKINDNATITALLTDASGNPIGGDEAIFTTRGGTFANSSSSYRATLDPLGKASIKVTSPKAGQIWVYVAAANTDDSISLMFTNNALAFTADKNTLTVGGNDVAVLTATYRDSSGNPVVNAPITFSTNAGIITAATANTNSSGQAQTTLKSANFATTATVVASATAGNAVLKIAFVSSIPKKIKFTLSPDNIGINGGVASLTATVTDSNDNMVTGADVNFRILKGPGGGEYIDKPVATSQNGIAHAQLYAGSVPSMYRACLVSATVGTIADTTKLTISGEPYAISVSRPQDDSITVPNSGQLDQTTFDYNVGAVVVDINGNPVADGTRVNFSTVVSGMAVHQKYFVKWKGLGGTAEEISAVCAYGKMDIPFEDINNNYHMDENDLKLDYNDAVASRGDDVNGDGVCDFDPLKHDLWIDFNSNGQLDTGSTIVPITVSVPILHDTTVRVNFDSIIHYIIRTSPDTLWGDSVRKMNKLIHRSDTTGYRYDTTGVESYYPGAEPSLIVGGKLIWADLYPNGVWDKSELVRDVNGNGKYDVPASGDRRWWEHETLPYWFGQRFDFDRNDYGIAVTTSATTTAGVAYAKLTYPRQLARRLIVSVNAEANGVRDRTGERFVLPVIGGQ